MVFRKSEPGAARIAACTQVARGRIPACSSSVINSRWITGWVILTVTAFSFRAASADEFFVSNSKPAIIFKYDAAGVTTQFASDGLYNPLGLAIDASGNVYVAHDGSEPGQNGAILKFDPTGKLSVFAEMP
jgi:hypothetical protein